MNRADIIHQIVNELDHLSESDLEKVHKQISQLRRRPNDQPDHSLQPFVDEIERVKEQTRNVPGASEERNFT